MTISTLNDKAFEFVDKIKVIENKASSEKKQGSFSELPVTDISNYQCKKSPWVERSVGHDNLNTKITITIDEVKYGFSDNDYPYFFSFIHDILNIEKINQLVTNNYLEEKVFLWIINIYRNKKADRELFDFLLDSVEKDAQDMIFYFPILNLHISKSFRLGNVDITFFTKQYFDSLWDKYKESGIYTEEVFDGIFRKYQGRVCASVRVKAISYKAKEIAFEECSYAIDVLKMYTPTVLFPLRKCNVDLEERININYQSGYLSRVVDSPDGFHVSYSVKSDPINLDDNFFDLANKTGLEIFSNFLKKRGTETELDRLIKQSMMLYSIALSTNDLHFRISQLITISESLLLKDEERPPMTKKCINRFALLLFQDEESSAKLFIDELNELYQIRNEIIHKANRKIIDFVKLSHFQISIIELLQRLINIERRISNKPDLIAFIDQK